MKVKIVLEKKKRYKSKVTFSQLKKNTIVIIIKKCFKEKERTYFLKYQTLLTYQFFFFEAIFIIIITIVFNSKFNFFVYQFISFLKYLPLLNQGKFPANFKPIETTVNYFEFEKVCENETKNFKDYFSV